MASDKEYVKSDTVSFLAKKEKIVKVADERSATFFIVA